MAIPKISLWGVAIIGVVLSGCASSDPASPDYDPTFVALGQNFSRPAPLPSAPFVAAGARRSGEFPSFARMPQGAAAQMTAVEREIMQAEMAAAVAERRNDATAASRYRVRVLELQEIARSHGEEARSQIEN